MRKILISIIFGLLCFFCSFYYINYHFTDYKSLYLFWSLIFPTLITIVWGKKYGVISLTLGLGALYPVLICTEYGMGNLIGCFTFFIWIVAQGYGAERREKVNKMYYNRYFIHFVFVIVHIFLYFVVFPCLLNINQYVYPNALQSISHQLTIVLAIKEYINLLIVLNISDVLLFLPFVRRFFSLSIHTGSRYNTIIFTSILLSGYLYIALTILIQRLLISNERLFPNQREYLTIINITIIIIAIAGLILRIVQNLLSAQEKIRKKEAQYNNLFENIRDIYFEFDSDGIILVVSPSVKNILGYHPEELIGKHINLFYPDIEQRKKIVEKLYKDLRIDNYEVILKDINGGLHNLWFSLKVIVNSEGHERIIGTSKEVSKYLEAKRIQQETEERFKILTEKMMTGFVALKPEYDVNNQVTDYIIVNANPSVNKHTLQNHNDLIGLKLNQFDVHEIISYQVCESILRTGESIDYESVSLKYKTYFRINAFRINENEIGIVFNNITTYINAVNKIKELHDNLEQRVIERTEELCNAINELEVFSYTISHDLKSPLRAIDAYSKIIIEDYGDVIEPVGIEMINHIQNLCSDTTNMINKLLAYGETSKTTLTYVSIDLRAMFLSTFEDMIRIYPDRIIELIVQENLPQVMGDKVLIQMAVINILSNAVKFTKMRAHAIIEVGFEIKERQYLFYVKDNGVGFNMTYSGKLFGIFERVHSDKEFEGSGVGLATVQKIIQMHGGETMIEGKVDEGATLFFTLPQS